MSPHKRFLNIKKRKGNLKPFPLFDVKKKEDIPNKESCIRENKDWVKDALYGLFESKPTDAPVKPLDYSTLENTTGTDGKSIKKDLFGDGMGKQAIYEYRTNYLDPMIRRIVGGQYEIISVIHRSDDAPKRDQFAKGLPIIDNDENDENENNFSSESPNLPLTKRVCI